MRLNWRVIILWDLVSKVFLSCCDNISRPKTNKICGHQKYLFFHLFLYSQSSMSFFTVIVEGRCPEYRTKSNIAFWNFGKWIFLSEEKWFASFGRFKGFLIYCHSVSVSIFIEKWWLMMQFILQKCDHFHHLYFVSKDSVIPIFIVIINGKCRDLHPFSALIPNFPCPHPGKTTWGRSFITVRSSVA